MWSRLSNHRIRLIDGAQTHSGWLCVVLMGSRSEVPRRGEQTGSKGELYRVADDKRRESENDRFCKTDVQRDSQPRHADRINADLANEHRRYRTEDRSIRTSLRVYPADNRCEQKPEEVSGTRTLPAARLTLEPRQTDESRSEIHDHCRRGSTPAESAANEEHPEGLSGDRDRRERQMDDDLCEGSNKASRTEHKRCVSDALSRNEIGEDQGSTRYGYGLHVERLPFNAFRRPTEQHWRWRWLE